MLLFVARLKERVRADVRNCNSKLNLETVSNEGGDINGEFKKRLNYSDKKRIYRSIAFCCCGNNLGSLRLSKLFSG